MPYLSSSDPNYTRSIRIASSAAAIFDALTRNLEGWWSAMDRPVSGSGDVFTVSWGEPWYRFKVTQYLHPDRLSWLCTDANQIIHGLEGVQKEWVGTELQWSIRETGQDECLVNFTHQGLIPECFCYDFCATTWDRFIGERLKSFLEG